MSIDTCGCFPRHHHLAFCSASRSQRKIARKRDKQAARREKKQEAREERDNPTVSAEGTTESTKEVEDSIADSVHSKTGNCVLCRESCSPWKSLKTLQTNMALEYREMSLEILENRAKNVTPEIF